VLNHPGERAQQIWASSLYLKTNYGINISYGVIYNEPSMAYTILTDDIKALGPRFLAQGLATQVQYAEAVAPQTDWSYITPVLNDPDMWKYVGRISYHDYGTADPYRSYLRDFGSFKGLTTAQTEMGDPLFEDLYNDLTLAGVSYWEAAYSAALTLTNNTGLTAFTPSGTYFRLRELMHYVRPGAVRIGAVSGDPSLHVLAFSQNGSVTTIIENTSASVQTINLSALQSIKPLPIRNEV
jgi:O-glycosyl hydrolase